jgi:UDP-N-acetylmuramoylalanine--D-glutamate ligase
MAVPLELRGKRVLVIGLARTGMATALFCATRGARVTATDLRGEAEIPGAAKLRAAGVQLHLGSHDAAVLDQQELVIPSPGVAADAPLLAAARRAQIPIWSEIELASRFLHEGTSLIGITGSNGKTTTTSLIAHILESNGLHTLLAGNIGTPLIGVVDRTTDDTRVVAELSSFQLEWIASFRPRIALLLNLTPDHLDRHGSLEAYTRAKARIFENQQPADAAILNADDPAAAALAPSPPQVYWFSRRQPVEQGTYVRGNEIVFRSPAMHTDELVLRLTDIPLPGAHNLENVLAAATAARLAGVAAQDIPAAVRTFHGVEHRLEFVAEISGVRYYNDSKATNVDATQKALEAFPGRILIILGGKDKGSDYTTLRTALQEKALLAILIGAAAEKIAGQISGSVPVEQAGTLGRAVEIARNAARPGDTVLLAPACASFDQFENYEQRGRIFKQLVNAAADRAAQARAGARLPAER